MKIPTLISALLTFTAGGAVAQAVDMDVPFVTTPPAVTEAMLTMAGVGPADFVLDLGSGDGRIVILAAKKFGARGLGVEIDPRLVAQSREYAARAGVADRAEFRDEDLFKTDLAIATVVTMYLLPDVNLALRPRLLALKPGTRVVSHDWDMGDWTPDAERRLPAPEKTLGLDRTSRVMLWVVPADFGGRWCRAGKSPLHLTQRYQQLEGKVTIASLPQALKGKIAGTHATFDGAAGVARLNGNELEFAKDSALAGAWRRCAQR